MAKVAPFAATEPGMANIEVLLPLALRLVDDGMIDLNVVLACLTIGPASCFGIDAGSLSKGSFADFFLFDSTLHWTWSVNERRTKGHNSPFFGDEMVGKVKATYVSGNQVM